MSPGSPTLEWQRVQAKKNTENLREDTKEITQINLPWSEFSNWKSPQVSQPVTGKWSTSIIIKVQNTKNEEKQGWGDSPGGPGWCHPRPRTFTNSPGEVRQPDTMSHRVMWRLRLDTTGTARHAEEVLLFNHWTGLQSSINLNTGNVFLHCCIFQYCNFTYSLYLLFLGWDVLLRRILRVSLVISVITLVSSQAALLPLTKEKGQ